MIRVRRVRIGSISNCPTTCSAVAWQRETSRCFEQGGRRLINGRIEIACIFGRMDEAVFRLICRDDSGIVHARGLCACAKLAESVYWPII